MGKHKIKISELSRATDIHRNTLTALYQETAVRVDLEVIDKLCAYFDCGVCELFEYDALATNTSA
jgi:putative transcriptional regulator